MCGFVFFFQFPWFFYDPVYVGNLKFKKVKWLSEEALQISEKTGEVKPKEKGKIYSFEYRVPKNSKER